jgi:hypothetical protein
MRRKTKLKTRRRRGQSNGCHGNATPEGPKVAKVDAIRRSYASRSTTTTRIWQVHHLRRDNTETTLEYQSEVLGCLFTPVCIQRSMRIGQIVTHSTLCYSVTRSTPPLVNLLQSMSELVQALARL